MFKSSLLKSLLFVFLFIFISIPSVQATIIDSLRDRINIHGYASQGFLGSTHNRFMFQKTSSGSFEFNDFAVNLSCEITDDLRFAFQLGSHDLGYVYHNHIEFDWGFMEYRPLDWLGFRGGRLKAPIGLYNETWEIDMARVPIFLPLSFYQEAFRDAYGTADGGSIFGSIGMGKFGTLSYNFLVGYLRGRNDGPHATQSEYSGKVKVHSMDYKLMYMNSLTWHTPVEGLLFNTTNFYGHGVDYVMSLTEDVMPLIGLNAGTRADVNPCKLTSYTFSSEYTYNKWLFAAEFRYADIRIRRTTNSPVIGRIYQSYGYRLQGAYLSGAYEVTNNFSVGSYVSYYKSPGPKSKIKTGKTMDYCLSFRYDITNWSLIKLEGHYFHGDSNLFERDQKRTKRDWLFYALKFTVYF